MSKKKKKTMGNIKINDANDIEKTEAEGQDTEQAEENVQESPEAAEDMNQEAEENTAEPESDIQPQEEAESDPEEKPRKKERKLKWARSDAEEPEKKENILETKLQEAADKYARLFAEFDNFRKRSEKEKAQRYDFGAKDMVERILPVIDNFERGLAAAQKEGREDDSFVKGMEMTYKLLLKTLEDAGVKPIEAVGAQFNPDFHNAVMHVDDPEAGENIIVEEFQKGYTYKDHVVRYSMVKVAN